MTATHPSCTLWFSCTLATHSHGIYHVTIVIHSLFLSSLSPVHSPLQVGDWRGHFTEEQSQRLDAVFQEKSSAEMRIAFWGKDIAQTLEAVQVDADQESESPS